MGQSIHPLNLESPESLCRTARALSSRTRVDIMRLINERHMISVNEIASVMNIPLSSAAMHVCVLEEAGLITAEKHPGIRGQVKMCSLKQQEIMIQLGEKKPRTAKVYEQELPLGAYAGAYDIKAPSGLASLDGPIGEYNKGRSFYLTARLKAQMIWFASGWLEYIFALPPEEPCEITGLEISFEACANARADAEAWRSDAEVKVNGIPLGSQACICQHPDRRGRLNPPWWPDVATQYGTLLSWRVDQAGTWRQNSCDSSLPLSRVLQGMEGAGIRIAVGRNASLQTANGINLFGRQFGDYEQSVKLTVHYS